MNKQLLLEDDEELLKLFNQLKRLHERLDTGFRERLSRSVPLADAIGDRWERGSRLGFGTNTNVYDSALILGDVIVGQEGWIGPNTILDGSGSLIIGDYCTISAGVQIYTHDNVRQTLTSKHQPIERAPVRIGSNVYIAPNALITKGIIIGSNVIIGAFALVNRDIPDNSVVFGQPAMIKGTIKKAEDGTAFTIQYAR